MRDIICWFRLIDLGPAEPPLGDWAYDPPALGWIRLGYGELTENSERPSDHLDSLFFSSISIEITLDLLLLFG